MNQSPFAVRFVLAHLIVAGLASSAWAVDIVLTPPAAGGVAVTNAAGTTTRFRVADDGTVMIPGIAATTATAAGLCVEIASGKVGTCSIGSITSLVAGTGLSGGTITTTGTLSIAASYQLPQSCTNGQVATSNGAGGWTCATPVVSGGTVTGVTASAPLASSGGTAPIISLTGSVPVANGGTGQTTLASNGVLYGQGTTAVGTAVGVDGQVLAGTAGAPAWTGSPSLSGNLTLADSTATTGNIMKGTSPFIHNYGSSNTFIGVGAGNFTMTGYSNTVSGGNAFRYNTTGNGNTASGTIALYGNTTGNNNTANGSAALQSNTTGSYNTASGGSALYNNTIGGNNTASGYEALWSNMNAYSNTASGFQSLRNNTSGGSNTASGVSALRNNTTGNYNSAYGVSALYNNTTGGNNIAIGISAGLALTTGSYNIDIGNWGAAAESNTTRIGDANQTRAFIAGIRGVTTGNVDAIPVLIDSAGQLGTASSSRRYKDDIADMEETSSALMKLRPVTFHYKADQNPDGRRLQYGLVAEEVAEVYPGLIAHSADGQIETVMYQFLPPMLLNEVQKQQRTIEAQAARIADLERDRAAQSTRSDVLEGELAAIKHTLGLR